LIHNQRWKEEEIEEFKKNILLNIHQNMAILIKNTDPTLLTTEMKVFVVFFTLMPKGCLGSGFQNFIGAGR
jgi:hypothetical protein